ncbi:MAG: glycine-rich domain-containing protein [Rubrivivax sp.]
MSDSTSAIATLLIGAAFGLWAGIALTHRRVRQLERERRIREHVFSRAVLEKVRETYPHLRLRDVFLVARALRAFFLIHLRAGSRSVEMPSRAVDALWHAFILDTRAYADFCRRAFGHFLHHLPANPARLDEPGRDGGPQVSDAMQLTWVLACREENIDASAPTRLPLLFALDAKLSIPGGMQHRTEDFARRREPGGDGGGGESVTGTAASSKGSGADADAASGDGGGGGCGGGD